MDPIKYLCLVIAIILHNTIAFTRIDIVQSAGLVKSAVFDQLENSNVSTFTVDLNILDGETDQSKLAELLFERSDCGNIPKGMSLVVHNADSASSGYLYAFYDAVYSSRFCGMKAVDFFLNETNMNAHSHCIYLNAEGFHDKQSYVQSLILRILHAVHSSNRSISSVKLLFLISDEGEWTSIQRENVTATLREWTTNVAVDYPELLDLQPKCFFWNSQDSTQLQNLFAAMSKVSPESRPKPRFASQSTGTVMSHLRRIVAGWRHVPVTVPKVLLSQAEKRSLVQLDMVYTHCLAHVNAIAAPWHQRVGSGKLVGKFADRVRCQLYQPILDLYLASTETSSSFRERYRRAEQLKEYLRSIAVGLLKQQLILLEAQQIQAMRKQLTAAFAAEASASKDVAVAANETAIIDAVIDTILNKFNASVAELEVPELDVKAVVGDGSVSGGYVHAMQDVLLKCAEEYLQTTAKLEAMSRMEGQLRRDPMSPTARRQARRKVRRSPTNAAVDNAEQHSQLDDSLLGRIMRRIGLGKLIAAAGIDQFGIKPALSLVGMFRPPGYGNLQGFVGYATSLAGLPLDLLLGVQNDGDSPEVLGEDREQPWLRLQPKIHFEVAKSSQQ